GGLDRLALGLHDLRDSARVEGHAAAFAVAAAAAVEVVQSADAAEDRPRVPAHADAAEVVAIEAGLREPRRAVEGATAAEAGLGLRDRRVRPGGGRGPAGDGDS